MLQDLFFRSLDEDAFAAFVVRSARAIGYTEPLNYDPANFRLTQSTGEALQINLGNVYEEYLAAPFWRRKAIVSRFVGVLSRIAIPVESSLGSARSHLFPRVRERMYYEAML